jgi:hypothetical protein
MDKHCNTQPVIRRFAVVARKHGICVEKNWVSVKRDSRHFVPKDGTEGTKVPARSYLSKEQVTESAYSVSVTTISATGRYHLQLSSAGN